MDQMDDSRPTMGGYDELMLEGVTIYDPMDEEVGTVAHVHGTGASMQVAVDVGTILGMGGKTVLIPVSALEITEDDDGDILITSRWTREQVEALPEHEM